MSKPKKQNKLSLCGTGSDLIDHVVGGAKGARGLPFGAIHNIVGDSSSGKTFLANEIIATAYHTIGPDKLKWEYDDCESGFSFDTVPLYGFEIMPSDPSLRSKSSTVEEAFCNIKTFADSVAPGEYGIYVLDSLDGLTSEEQDKRADERLAKHAKGEAFEKGSYGMGKQKYLSQEFFPQLADYLEERNVMLIIISQVRENIDSFSFAKFTRSGGKALQFYCHTVIWLKTLLKIEKLKRPIGVNVEAKTSKSKTPRPFRSCMFSFLFSYGLDNIGSNLDFLFNLRGDSGALLKVAQSVTWKGIPKTVDNLWTFANTSNEAVKFGTVPGKSSKKSKIVDFIADMANKHPEVQSAFDKEFGSPMTREELIAYIEDNSLQAELTKRVEDKWEQIEDSIKPARKGKYQ